MISRLQRRLLAAQAFAVFLVLVPSIASADDEGVIIRCARPCTAAIAAVRSLGGEVTEQYRNADAVAARLPKTALPQLGAALGADQVIKDSIVGAPFPQDVAELSGEQAPVQSFTLAGQELTQLLATLPNNYNFNNNLTGAATLHAAGKIGQDVIVGVIDTGTANWAGVPALAGTVIGGENLVPGISEPPATSRLNAPHGTWVGSMIAAHANFIFNNSSLLVQSLNVHSPSSVIPCPTPFVAPCSATRSIIPMIGTAPGAKIYALKVFAAAGGGSPESRIIAAMDRAITLRRNFNNGVPSVPVSGSGTENSPFVFDSLNIQVVNMSLGGSTLFAGRDLEDVLTQEMLAVGITIVTSAGNDGFAAITGGSPGTGLGSLTSGAANTVVHERVVRDLQFGLGFGELFRASTHIQTADFSARGPTADGRRDPELVANGYFDYAQAANGRIFFVSGTSFSSPTVAGAAALLRKESTNTTATQVRNALWRSANPNTLGDNSGPNDQGKGFLDVPAALSLLLSGNASKKLPDSGHHDDDDDVSSSVADNIQEQGFKAINFKNDSFAAKVNNLVPGQVKQFFVPVDATTDELTVTLSNVTPQLPPTDQNQLFGDDVFIQIVDAPTSSAEVLGIAFVPVGQTFIISNPQTGLVRVALQGDWTNAGAVSADVTITRKRSSFGKRTADGDVAQGEQELVEVNIPAGAAQAVFELHWDGHWGRYPTNDLDMILIPPVGAPNFTGATLSSPERVVLANPAGGIWTVLVDGFTVRSEVSDDDDEDGVPEDDWKLAVTADGVRLQEAND